ncbi:MAG: MFS transporter [Verrucomicrobiota bacterium]|nr:MFS transporter [Verrucomicrobiota bacterium]
MSTTSSPVENGHSSQFNSSRLFFGSCIALIVTAMSFAIRGDIMGPLGTQFELNNEQLGYIAGTAFWGFTLAMIFGGPLCDVIGIGRLLGLAFLGHLVGIIMTIFAKDYTFLFMGTLAIGLGNGFVEAACNPLVASVYPTEKTKKLNQFHVWFPGGIVIGGLLCYALSKSEVSWQIKMATMFIPLAIYGALFVGQKFPKTERVTSGVSTGSMFKHCLRPLFLVMVACMFLTGSTELGPGQWIPNILTFSAGVSGILVLVWINGIMAVGRQFAGPVVHALSPTRMLLFSSVLAAIGLFWLGYAKGSVMTFAAATVFALGVCYFWPTMLGFVAERLPQTGALGLAIMGGAGMLSVAFILPVMGKIYDKKLATAIPSGYSAEQLKGAVAGTTEAGVWAQVQAMGGAMTLKYVALLPVLLIAAFLGLAIYDKLKGGYNAIALSEKKRDDF